MQPLTIEQVVQEAIELPNRVELCGEENCHLQHEIHYPYRDKEKQATWLRSALQSLLLEVERRMPPWSPMRDMDSTIRNRAIDDCKQVLREMMK